jgi:YgiT-type zinc finger domain-containing protein
MICLICWQAELVDGFTSVNFERGEIRFITNHVPARICPNCGEAYINEEVTVQLLEDAEKLSRLGIMDVVREYEV